MKRDTHEWVNQKEEQVFIFIFNSIIKMNTRKQEYVQEDVYIYIYIK